MRSRSVRSRLVRGEWLPFLAIAGTIAACGPSIPREQDIYHQDSLRPGAVPAHSEAERELLAQLGTSGENTTVQAGDQTFVVLTGYASASGRRCVRLQQTGGGRLRVACERDGTWTFVPDVFDGEDPFASEASP